MLIGETPGEIEDETGLCFQGEVGNLLNKMLLAIDIKRENIYTTYSINFRPPEDCLLYTSPSPRDSRVSRMPSSA